MKGIIIKPDGILRYGIIESNGKVKEIEDPKCDKCGLVISIEHGGIGCKVCDTYYCCDPNCIPEKYLEESIGQSHGINSCPKCDTSSERSKK